MRGIFAEHAPGLRQVGLAVLPCEGKKPVISKFNMWRAVPAPQTIHAWAAKFPDANIGAIPWLSGHVVVDIDDDAQLTEAIRLFGDSPLQVQTGRGVHLWYRAGAWRKPLDLRQSHGLAVEVVAGPGDFVLVPPSLHASGAAYSFRHGGWQHLPSLPIFKPPIQPMPKSKVPEGERGLTLNKLLCKHAPFCDALEEVFDKAQSINDEPIRSTTQ